MRFRRSKAEGAHTSAAEVHERVLDEGPSLLSMVRIVAIAVALIILVSFAAGYGFARLFV
jgi:hypothetical protein